MKKLLYNTLIISLLVSSLKAQQLPLTKLYNVNKFQTNSAYAGFNNCTESYLSHDSQWVGIEGSPTIQYLSTHSGLRKNMALGANLVFDKTDIISKFSGALSYAYHIKLNQYQNIRFGLSAGIYQVYINPSNAIIEDVTDDIIVSGTQSRTAFKNDLSAYYNYRKLEIGVAIPQIFGTTANFDKENIEGNFGLTRCIISTINYDIDLPEKFSFQPSLFYQSSNGYKNQFDINGQITYNRLLSVGVGYRTDAGMLARIGLTIKESLMIAYAYEFSSRNYGLVSNRSHEIMVGIKFCRDKNKKLITFISKVNKKPIIANVEPQALRDAEALPIIADEIVVEEVKINVLTYERAKELPSEIEAKVFDIKIQFPLNNDNIDNSFYTALDEIANVMLDNSELSLRIIGHSCDLGSNQVKENISIKRAEDVKEYLIKQGVEASRMVTIGMSDTQQIVPNTSETNRQKNRRVEFILK
jgi:type IX secretion system PorP/SprF family membrane protein